MITPLGPVRCPCCGGTVGLAWVSDNRVYLTRGERESFDAFHAANGITPPADDDLFRTDAAWIYPRALMAAPWCEDPNHHWTVPQHKLTAALRRAKGGPVTIRARRLR